MSWDTFKHFYTIWQNSREHIYTEIKLGLKLHADIETSTALNTP